MPFYVGTKNRPEGLTKSVGNGIIMLDDISRDIVVGDPDGRTGTNDRSDVLCVISSAKTGSWLWDDAENPRDFGWPSEHGAGNFVWCIDAYA